MSSVCLSCSDRQECHLTPDSAVNYFIDNKAQVDEEDKEDKEEEEENGVSTYLSPCDSISLTGISRLYRQQLWGPSRPAPRHQNLETIWGRRRQHRAIPWCYLALCQWLEAMGWLTVLGHFAPCGTAHRWQTSIFARGLSVVACSMSGRLLRKAARWMRTHTVTNFYSLNDYYISFTHDSDPIAIDSLLMI